MRTARLSLGIFALALILPLLLLACGGSDEPTDGASSGRATDEPESRTSSGQTTAEPASPETDRETLVALYNATGGPNWTGNDNWLSDVPISKWQGVTTDDNGRVTELDLDASGLSGEIPPELGNLENLTVLALIGNHLTGEIPPELGNLATLAVLDLDGNQSSGCVPSSLQGQLLSSSNLSGLPFCP